MVYYISGCTKVVAKIKQFSAKADPGLFLGCAPLRGLNYHFNYSGTPLIRSLMGPKKLGRINGEDSNFMT